MTSFDATALKDRLRMRVAPAFVADGWRIVDEPEKWHLARRRGTIDQKFSFGAYASGGGIAHVLKTDRSSEYVETPPRVQINIYLGFSCDAISTGLRTLLPEDADYLDADRAATPGWPDFAPGMKSVFQGARGLDGEWIEEMGELDAWITDFLAWYESHGRGAYDDCSDIASLNRLLHSPWSLEARQNVGFSEMLAILVLVHFAGDPQVKFLDWLGVVRNSQRNMRSTVDTFTRNPEWYKDGPPRDVRDNEIVDRLIERIRRRRPPNS